MNCHTWLHCLLRMLIIARDSDKLTPGDRIHIAWLIDLEARDPCRALAQET